MVETADMHNPDANLPTKNEIISASPSYHGDLRASHHHHLFTRPAGNTALIGPAATLGWHSGRFGNAKSPFRVVVPSLNNHPTMSLGPTPPVCSTPQNNLPILDSLLESSERVIPDFSTFGSQLNGFATKQRSDSIEPNGHLV